MEWVRYTPTYSRPVECSDARLRELAVVSAGTNVGTRLQCAKTPSYMH